MTGSVYPVRLAALEDQRHELVLRKLQAEQKLRQLKDQIRDAYERRDDTSELTKQRDAVNNELTQIAIDLAELRREDSRERRGFKTAFLKMAKKILPRRTYEEIYIAANELLQQRNTKWGESNHEPTQSDTGQ